MLEKIYYDGTRKRQKIKSQYKGVEMAEISVQYGEIESLLEAPLSKPSRSEYRELQLQYC